MDIDSRLKALGRLAESETDDARMALRKELERTRASIASATQYDVLENDIAVLRTIGHRFSRETVDLVLTFMRTIDRRQITYSDRLAAFADRISEYQNAETLTVLAIDVLVHLRYRETSIVLPALTDLSRHTSEIVRKRADAGLSALTRYEMEVFRHIGAEPQKVVVHSLDALTDEELAASYSAVLTLTRGLLSPTIEGTAWTYKSFTISRGATPALPAVKEIRSRVIGILVRLYGVVSTTAQKLSVIGALSDASRSHNLGDTGELANMISENTAEVLRFFRNLVDTEDLQIVQKIEASSFWMFYHAGSEEVKTAARAVEQSLANHKEYQIYKTLIGFEGVFVPWDEEVKEKDRWSDTDKQRRERAAEFVSGINPGNFEEWRGRIVTYAKTESDDLATFPVFYHFLESFAVAQPKLAMKLVSEDVEKIDRFLIPLLRGLWAGSEQKAIRSWIEESATNGRYLYQSLKVFLDNDKLDRDLTKSLLRRAADTSDLHTVALAASVAVSNFREGSKFVLEELFLPALGILTKNSSASWIFDFWYRPQARAVIAVLDSEGIAVVLENLRLLKKIDYHAEEVLALIAQRYPEDVLKLLCARLEDARERDLRTFDAIPYEMHKLSDALSKNPRAAVRIVREGYDGDFSMFIHRGGHLLKTIFPSFSQAFEKELSELLRSGNEDDFEFVLAVLRNYQGQPFIHEIAKKVVQAVPADSEYRTEVGAVLMTTGVVTGPYGFAEAYARKKEEMEAWLSDPDEKVRSFAKAYIEKLDKIIVADRKRADEEITLRKHRYGE
jgi:hypothetical protein